MRTQTHRYSSTNIMFDTVGQMEDNGWAVRSMQPTSWTWSDQGGHEAEGVRFAEEWVVVYEIANPS